MQMFQFKKNLNLEFLPKFYHDVITAYAYMQSKTKIHDIDSILDENIFGNSNIIFSHAPLWFESFSKSGFKKIKDIWDSAHKTFHSEIYICNRLADKTNWRIYYNRIKSRIPKNWIEKLESNATHAKVTNILNVKDSIYMYDFKNEFIQPIKLTYKHLQRYLRDVHRPKCELKWEAYFNETFNWRKVWKLSLDLPCSNKEKQFHWKIIHNALFTESKLQLMGMSNGSCHFCETDSETLHHLFYQCRITQNFILKVENALNILLRNKLNVAAIKIQLKHLILGFLHADQNIQTLMIFVLHLLKWELWKQRNLVKFENRIICENRLFEQFRNKLKSCSQFLHQTLIA